MQESLFDVTVRPERRYYRQMLDALSRSDFGAVALDAELVVANLFGTVWAAQPVPRDGSVDEAFGLGLVEYVGQRPTPTAVALLRAVAAVAPVREVRQAAVTAADVLVARGVSGPQWTDPAPVGDCWAHEDVFGDQTTVVIESTPALRIELDHVAAAVDAELVDDSARLLRELRHRSTVSNGTSVLHQVEPGWTRAVLARAVAQTDLVPGVAVRPGFAGLRAIVLAQLAKLPAGPDPILTAQPPDAAGRAALVADFLASHEALALADSDFAAAVATVLVDYGCTVNPAAAARVSPATWDAFLADWWPVHQIAGGDGPSVMRAWSSWAARRMALPEAARAELAAALDEALAD